MMDSGVASIYLFPKQIHFGTSQSKETAYHSYAISVAECAGMSHIVHSIDSNGGPKGADVPLDVLPDRSGIKRERPGIQRRCLECIEHARPGMQRARPCM